MSASPAISRDAAEIIRLRAENARLRGEIGKLSKRQAMLQQISLFLQQTLDLETLIGRIFSEVNRAVRAEAQSIWLVEPESQSIACRFATGPGAAQVKAIHVPLGEGIVGATVQNRQPFLIADAQKDPRHSRKADCSTGRTTHSLLSVPLVCQGVAIGAMQAINKRGDRLFTADDLDVLRGIAEMAALAIENARLFAALESSYDATLAALAAALDLRDEETEGHSRRVVAYTARLARQIGLDEAAIRPIRRGALIHDIGKIGVPDAILRKPGPLNREEREFMKRHPLFGYEMLRDIPHLREDLAIVLAHHERWDGGGYPFGLRETEIPLAARLFAVADTLDALLSDRPYRKGCSFPVARKTIVEASGCQFDPHVVEAFLAIPAREWHRIRRRVLAETAQREGVDHFGGVAGDQTGLRLLPFPPVKFVGAALPSTGAA